MSGELAVVGDVLSLLKRLEKAATDKVRAKMTAMALSRATASPWAQVTEDMLEALAALDRLSASITLQVLTKTKCGAAVNRLRVGSDQAVVQAAGSLVRKWKVIAERAGAKTSSSGPSSSAASSPAKPAGAPPGKPADPPAVARTTSGGSASSSTHLPRLPGTRHNVRKAFIDMFAKLTGATAAAASAPAPAPGSSDVDASTDVSPAEALAQCERVGSELELALFDALGGGGSGERPLPECVRGEDSERGWG